LKEVIDGFHKLKNDTVKEFKELKANYMEKHESYEKDENKKARKNNKK
jgi:hypothetical protein